MRNFYKNPDENYDKAENEHLNILKKELDILKQKKSFKIKDISNFIENISLGTFNKVKFNKVKFNKLIREKIIPDAEVKEKNQFLYNETHLPYAILLQCSNFLEVSDFKKLIIKIKGNSNSTNLKNIYDDIDEYINPIDDDIDEVDDLNLNTCVIIMYTFNIYINKAFTGEFRTLINNLLSKMEKDNNIKFNEYHRMIFDLLFAQTFFDVSSVLKQDIFKKLD
ncbi:hypothetical protein [Intestinibacter sp.]